MKVFLEGAELPGGLPTNLVSCMQLKFLDHLLPGAQEEHLGAALPLTGVASPPTLESGSSWPLQNSERAPEGSLHLSS